MQSLLLLLIPQVLNFVYSCPQLFRLVPCPRHRLPSKQMDANNKPTGLLVPSTMGPEDPRDNLTLLCLALRKFGAMHERSLCVLLMAFQVVCAVCALVIRYSHLDEY
jgi:UDP-N-acetylglucosamine--dolichyl-phosphate N-acetylglucosaminephosphotransferase